MKPKRIAVVAGSESGWVSPAHMKPYSVVIGVDRGAFTLLEKGIVPDVAIGDFDSVTKKDLEEIRKSVPHIKEYSPDKDQTDLELAVVYALSLHPQEIVLYGATGGRIDQGIAALHILQVIHQTGCRAVLFDEQNEMRFTSGKCQIKKQKKFSYLSILPCSDEIVVSMTGCQYSLQKHRIKKGSTLGVSNVIVSKEAEIIVHKGIAYVILSKDQ